MANLGAKICGVLKAGKWITWMMLHVKMWEGGESSSMHSNMDLLSSNHHVLSVHADPIAKETSSSLKHDYWSIRVSIPWNLFCSTYQTHQQLSSFKSQATATMCLG